MSTNMMIDNWTLQDVGRLLSQGIGRDIVGEISIAADRSRHSFNPVPQGVLEIDALLTLITNAVCFDSLDVDAGFAHSWKVVGEHFTHSVDAGVITFRDYSHFGND
jgi:hypothetical protein